MSKSKYGFCIVRDDGKHVARMPQDDGSRVWTTDRNDIRVWPTWSEAAACAAICGGEPCRVSSR